MVSREGDTFPGEMEFNNQNFISKRLRLDWKMYLSFYGLHKKPFQISTDPSFLWFGKKHKEALAILKYGIIENQGFLLLTGDVGTGKTTLINALVNMCGDEISVARVPDPGMKIIDFMNYISHAFGIKKKFVTKDAFLVEFADFLKTSSAAGKKNLLIIDEAQRLSAALLEEVRQLSNIEKQDSKLLNIFFIGHNEFNDVLLENRNRALRQRITINYTIEPLDEQETLEFVKHRLKVAGGKENIFTHDAIRNIHEFSGGLPRRINVICHHALLAGFVQGTKTVTGEMVEECAKDLLLPSSPQKDKSEPSESLDTAGSDILPEVPVEIVKDESFEDIQDVSSGRSWKVVSTVLLVAAAVCIGTYIKFPDAYRNLFFRIINTQAQAVNSKEQVQTQSINSVSVPDKSAGVTGENDTKSIATEVSKNESIETVELNQVPGSFSESPESSVSPVSTEKPPATDTPPGASLSVVKQKEVQAVEKTAEEKSTRTEGTSTNMISINPVNVISDKESQNIREDASTELSVALETPDDKLEEVSEELPDTVSRKPVHPLLDDLDGQSVDEAGEEDQLPNQTETVILKPLSEPGNDNLKGIETASNDETQNPNSNLLAVEMKPADMTEQQVSNNGGETALQALEQDDTKVEVTVASKEHTEEKIQLPADSEPAMSNTLSGQVEATETSEVIEEETESPDPGALVDWLLKKRTQ